MHSRALRDAQEKSKQEGVQQEGHEGFGESGSVNIQAATLVALVQVD